MIPERRDDIFLVYMEQSQSLISGITVCMYVQQRPECFRVRTSLVITRTDVGTSACIYVSKLNRAMLCNCQHGAWHSFCLCQLAFSIECIYFIYIIKTCSQTCTTCHVLTTRSTSLLAMRLTMAIVSCPYGSRKPEFSLPDHIGGIKYQPK